MITIQKIAVDKLTLHPQNPRKIDEAQFEKLCQSLKDNPELFDARPCLVNPQMVVFGGNMRLRAARKLGWTEVPCAVMDVTKEKQDEMMIRDNVSSGTFEEAMLAACFEVSKLEEWGVDMKQFGVWDEEVEEGEKEQEKSSPKKKEVECPQCAHRFSI